MPRRQVALAAASRASRRCARGLIGRLSDRRVKVTTQQRYRIAVHHFLHWCFTAEFGVAADLEQLDDQCSRYVEELWGSGECKSAALATLSGVQFFLFKKRILTRSWALCKVWNKLELAAQAPPMPVTVLLGLVGWAITVMQSIELAALFAVGFHGLLRTGEILSLAPAHVCIAESWSGVVALPATKIGAQKGTTEMITISEGFVGWLLFKACAGKLPHLPLAPKEHGFRRAFSDGLAFFGLQNLGLKPYSLRRGGATYDFATFGDLPRTLWRGRWASAATGRLYIQEGLAMQAQMRVAPRSKETLDARITVLKAWVAQQGGGGDIPLECHAAAAIGA